MRRALVVYESLFGHTRTIARAVAAGLAERVPVEALPVAQVTARVGSEVGLLVVGCPNHHLGMPTPESRREAARDFGARVAAGLGLREWLTALSRTGPGLPTAAFDTRLVRPRRPPPGPLTATYQNLLREWGFLVVAAPTHFYVASVSGPLIAGEEERARDWGRALLAAMPARAY